MVFTQVDAPVTAENTQVNAPVTTKNTQVDAQVTTENTQDKKKLRMIQKENAILDFCIEPRAILEIVKFLKYKERKSVRRILVNLALQGRIAMTIPDKPNSRLQKYITIK